MQIPRWENETQGKQPGVRVVNRYNRHWGGEEKKIPINTKPLFHDSIPWELVTIKLPKDRNWL